MREQKWPSWHRSLSFLSDEVKGKTVAIIGTGRIGLAMIKKCSGFDMNIVSIHVLLLREGETDKPTYHLINLPKVYCDREDAIIHWPLR